MTTVKGHLLSPSQETLWFLAQLSPVASAAYNVVTILRCDGLLDAAVLEQAIARVAERQEVLRAYFTETDGRPRMEIGAEYLGRLERLELPRTEDPDQAARALVAELAAQPFDLARPPLLRNLLLAGPGDGPRYFVTIVHHTIMDGWSLGIFLREVRAFYRAARRGEQAELPPLAATFAEVVARDRMREGSADYRQALANCQQRLAGAPALLELPLDRPRPATKHYAGAVLQAGSSGLAVQQVRELARSQRTTFFAPVCAAFVAVLWRMGGREDVVIGTPTASRPTVDHEAVIGPLINSLVLRNRVDPRAGFGALMQQVQESLLDALGDAEVPFEKVVEALNPERRDDVDPVFQVMFSLETPRELDSVFDDGLEVRPIDPQVRTTQLELTLIAAQEEQGGLDLAFNYDTGLFDPRTIGLIGQRLVTLLAAAVADPRRPLAELPWQAPAELALLDTWSRRASPFPDRATVPDFLRGRAQLTPDRIAIESAGGSLTYAELLARSRRLAARLRALGAGPEVPVGLLLDRTLDLPVAVLGVLEAGAAYLPLDPAYPPDRLRYVLEDSGARLLLTHGDHAERLGLAGLPGCRKVDLDQLELDLTAPGNHLAAAPGSAAAAGNLAYLLYTSGSTGKPKGVAITHRSLVNFLVSMAREPGLGPDDVLLAITTLSFDIAALELYLPLFCGAKMVLLDRESAGDARALQAAIASSRATALQATPATWQMLVAYRWPGRPGLKALCGGEGLPVALADELLERVGELWNVYGPTEATVWSSARRVLPGESSRLGEKTVTLGQPIANTDIHILDGSFHRQGIGIPGELVIGGDGLARGYWGRPALTADRFVPDPLSARRGARLYRTGDLARWRIDGELEFLGRLDFQVKVRGFRIELGEIESALSQHPGVKDRVVVALPGPGGQSRLVAYVVPADPAAPPSAEELQEFLGRGLPSHMVPAAFVSLAALPLTPNLKVDRKALPPPGGAAPAAVARAPRGEVELRLHAIYSEVLGLPEIDPAANFFALGGHSLLATRVLARIRDAFGVALPLRVIFRHPTLGQMASHLEQELPPPALAAPTQPAPGPAAGEPAAQEQAAQEQAAREQAAQEQAAREQAAREQAARERAENAAREKAARELAAPRRPEPEPARPGPATDEIFDAPLTFGQERLWLVAQLGRGANASYNVTFLTCYRGKLEPERLRRAFGAVVARHAILRTSIVVVEGTPVQRIHPSVDWEMKVVDLHGGPAEREAQARALAVAMVNEPFELDRAPLFRLIFGRTPAHQSWLNLTFHHTIFDESSQVVLYRELDEIYAALGEGRSPSLPAPGFQMADLARRQRARLASGALEDELEYWRRELAGAPPLLELPADRPRPPVPSFAGDRFRWTVPDGTRARLLGLRARTGQSLYSPLLAAFALLLARLAGTRDLVVGTPVSQRDEGELENLMGFLVQTALLRIAMPEQSTFIELAAAVREKLFGTLEHLELPFEYLVDKLATERTASFNPLFQVMFVFDKAVGGSETRLGLPFDELKAIRRTSHFDLTLIAFDFPEVLELAFDFATDLFEERTIRGWAGLLDRLLEAASRDPEAEIGALPWLTPAAEAALVAGGRGPVRVFELGRRKSTLFELFARQAAQTPEAAAVAGPDAQGVFGQWTYAELAAHAASVAAALAEAGLAPGSPVATCFKGGRWGVAALLGVLQAGGFYVPLDPGAPAARLVELLAASGATLLLAESGGAPELPGFTGRILPADHLPARPGPPPRGDAALPAYLIFTSGSTGKPKGVLVPQSGVINLTHAFVAAHGFRAGQRWLVVPPLYFDASVGDIFPALSTGGALVFPPASDQLGAAELVAFCAQQDIRVIDTAAALFKGWVDSWRTLGQQQVLPRLEVMMVGGEAVGLDQLAAWRRLQGGRGGARFFNHYGPTETSVCATLCATADGSELRGAAELPIGRPLANVTAYVTDDRLEIQPDGVPGELWIGGAGLAFGYLGAPARTAEAFRPDPFSAVPGARLYRTGDRARRRADGQLEFLGRADRQVKLRGYRIELGEIEAQLRRHPAVAEALATVREDQLGVRRLVAYLRLASPAAADELRRLLQEKLPAYMVPSAYVFLSAFPLTPNGKIDQRALPPPAPEERERQAPQGAAELRLAAIWRELLGGDPGAGDDFFESGGSSILLMQLATRLRQETGREIPLPALFEASRLADMARLVGAPGEAAAPAEPAPGLDLAAKVRLDPAIWPQSRGLRPVGRRSSFVTGGTGFLGAYLIDELLRRERGNIHVLVRAEDEDEARRRLRKNLRQYGLWRDDAAFRLIPVLGQLGQPRFGLAPETFAALAQAIDVIFHNAATVNFLAPYARLEAANVRGTEETLRLACFGGAVPVHFVSTLGVFLQPRYEKLRISEDEDPDWRGLHKGYEQTKWVAEKLVEAARERGLPARIHRPARVAGSSRDGAANTGDLFYSLVQGCVQLGAAPDVDEQIDLYPVDVLARAIVAVSQRTDEDPAAAGGAHHYYNDGTVAFVDLVRSLGRIGLPVQLLPYPAWRRRLIEAVAAGAVNALEPFLGLYPPEAGEDRQPSFDQHRTQELLRSAGIALPPADEKLLRIYWNFLLRSGFLNQSDGKPPAPAASRESNQPVLDRS